MSEQKKQEDQLNKDMIFASSFYLTKELPKNWGNWNEKKLNKYLTDHAWQPFEFDEAENIFENIEILASSLRSYIKNG